MIDKVFIFEVHYSNFNRYVHPLADYLIENDVAKEVYLIFDGFTKSELIKAPNSPRVHKRLAKEPTGHIQRSVGMKPLFFSTTVIVFPTYIGPIASRKPAPIPIKCSMACMPSFWNGVFWATSPLLAEK